VIDESFWQRLKNIRDDNITQISVYNYGKHLAICKVVRCFFRDIVVLKTGYIDEQGVISSIKDQL